MTKDEKEALLTHCGTIQLAAQLLIIELNGISASPSDSSQ